MAHYEYANQRYEGGIGSRLNAVRAQQEVSADEARVEDARLAIRRAQEALGVLIAADGPVDAAEEPTFEVPSPAVPDAQLVSGRQDLQVIFARESAAQRRAGDAWKDYLPSVTALFTPTVLAPTGLFANAGRGARRCCSRCRCSSRAAGGARRASGRHWSMSCAPSATTQNGRRVPRSEPPAKRSPRPSGRWQFAQTAAQQANEVVQITDVAFREGATTNIEVIDAQRQARDAETAAAIAEERGAAGTLRVAGRHRAIPVINHDDTKTTKATNTVVGTRDLRDLRALRG